MVKTKPETRYPLADEERCPWWGDFTSERSYGRTYLSRCSLEREHEGDHYWRGMRAPNDTPPSPPAVTIWFRRINYQYSCETTEFIEPKWHLFQGVDPGKYGSFRALCGYERKNLMGDLKFSRAKGGPKDGNEICKRCTAISRDTELSAYDEEVEERAQAVARLRAYEARQPQTPEGAAWQRARGIIPGDRHVPPGNPVWDDPKPAIRILMAVGVVEAIAIVGLIVALIGRS